MTMYNYEELPEGLQDGMQRYVEQGMLAGDFLIACLENDLHKAVSRADDKNIKLLPKIVQWMHWNLPNGCWGSQEVVAEWRGVDVITSLGDDASLCRT